MVNETTSKSANFGSKSRKERVEHARSRAILDVANELHMELVRSGRDYRWKEHDSMVISPEKNMWNWFSHHQGGDVISLVETMKEVNFNQAIDFLNDGSFKEFTAIERVQEPFSYYLEPYEQPFEAARSYLKDQRGLSDETIDFFLEKGVLAQANAKVNDSIEPVVVFKSFDFSGEMVGATLQGIEENWEKWPKRGYVKNIVRNSDGITGMHVDIGQPNRLIFAESAIDLMSYYELHKDNLQDVRLVSMDGLKEGVIGRHLAQLQSDISDRPLRWDHDQLAEGLQTAIDNDFFSDGKHADWITLAVDNDTGGRNFIDSLRKKGAIINEDLPDLQSGQDKTDWNDVLKSRKPDQMETEEQGVLFENLADVTSTTAHTMVPKLQVAFDFSENQVLSNKYHEGDIVLYQEFVKDFYPEMIRRRTESVALQNGYDKTYFALLDENNNELVKDIRFDLGDPTTRLSEEYENYLPPKYLTIAKEIDQNYFGDQSSIQVTESIKKAPEQAQEQMVDRTNGGTGSLQPEAEGSTSPVLETSTFERSVTSRPTSSYPYLHFTTNYAEVQKRIGNYHPITPVDLKRLNQYAPSIQSTARWYLDELADSKISFIYADRGIENILEVTFQKENFIHLSGIRPFEEGKGAADFLEDFASGYGSYDGVLISNAIKDKLQVLPMLQDILEPQSFVLDDLTSVEKLHNLNMSEAIKSKDEDFLLLFKDTGNEKIPASLMKLKGELATNVQELTEKTILGIYRERNGQIEQLAINDDYVKDDGKEMLSVLKNRQYEEILERIELQNEQLFQLENQSLNQELGKDLDRSLNVIESVSEDAEMGQEVSAISPKQELKDGLARRVEEITKQTRKEALVASIPELQEKLSRESDLIGSSLTDGGMLYTHQEAFGKDYQLELAVHSSTAVESLTEQPAPWNLAVLKDNQILGYLAYGGDWGNDFQIEDNLEGLVEQILSEEVSKGLYSQEEIDTFLKEIQVGEDRQNNQVEEFSSDASFDYEKASAYELSEIAFQKIREFTQSPEELAHYMDFMSKFPTLSPRNAALVQAQWPGANAVATFNQWQALGKTLGISSDDVVQTTDTFTNKKTGNSQEVTKQTLSVKAGEHAQITLFRPVMEEMIPVFDENGKQVINGKGHPKFKKKKEASLEEKQLIAEGKLKVVQFQVRDLETGQGKFTLYKVFELSQTNLKPEAYPKAMPNRHYNFETDKVKTKEVLLGLQDYAQKLGVSISTDEHHVLGNAKGAFYPTEQKILLNPDNSIGEKIGTTIHELAHATLHNFHKGKNDSGLSTGRKELEAEMTSYLVSKHFGLDTSEKAIQYMSHWTNQLKNLNDKELNQSMTRIHNTVSCVLKSVEKHTKPYQLNRNRGQNFGSLFPNKGIKI